MARDSQELQRILKASGKTTLNLPAIAGRETPQDEDQLAAVREVAEGQFDVLGEMGRGKKGSVVYLARDLSTQRLVALKLFHEGQDEYTLEVVQQLDGTVPALEGACARSFASRHIVSRAGCRYHAAHDMARYCDQPIVLR